MNCIDIRKELEAYTDHDLPEEKLNTIREHLNTCPACRQYYDQYAGIKSFAFQDDIPPVPHDLTEKVCEQIAGTHVQPRSASSESSRHIVIFNRLTVSRTFLVSFSIAIIVEVLLLGILHFIVMYYSVEGNGPGLTSSVADRGAGSNDKGPINDRQNAPDEKVNPKKEQTEENQNVIVATVTEVKGNAVGISSREYRRLKSGDSIRAHEEVITGQSMTTHLPSFTIQPYTKLFSLTLNLQVILQSSCRALRHFRPNRQYHFRTRLLERSYPLSVKKQIQIW